MARAHATSAVRQGAFTLIELSIVLVIIGLIVGGVLVGRDLIRAASVRATLAQIEKYKTASNTFRVKYGYLPGDIKEPEASRFGLAARGQFAGEGDGNGWIEGVTEDMAGQNNGFALAGGETAMFWRDLGTVKLIDGSFTSPSPTATPSISGSLLRLYMPEAKIGRNNYFAVWSNNLDSDLPFQNFLTVNVFNAIEPDENEAFCGLTVREAYDMDKKTDDGFPREGKMLAVKLAGSSWSSGSSVYTPWGTAATPGSSETCFDNGNVAGRRQTYSLGQNNSAGLNCAVTVFLE